MFYILDERVCSSSPCLGYSPFHASPLLSLSHRSPSGTASSWAAEWASRASESSESPLRRPCSPCPSQVRTVLPSLTSIYPLYSPLCLNQYMSALSVSCHGTFSHIPSVLWSLCLLSHALPCVTGIGLFPDVGSSSWLSHMPDGLGEYIGTFKPKYLPDTVVYTMYNEILLHLICAPVLSVRLDWGPTERS